MSERGDSRTTRGGEAPARVVVPDASPFYCGDVDVYGAFATRRVTVEEAERAGYLVMRDGGEVGVLICRTN